MVVIDFKWRELDMNTVCLLFACGFISPPEADSIESGRLVQPRVLESTTKNDMRISLSDLTRQNSRVQFTCTFERLHPASPYLFIRPIDALTIRYFDQDCQLLCRERVRIFMDETFMRNGEGPVVHVISAPDNATYFSVTFRDVSLRPVLLPPRKR
jgi:hypothetical protein